MTAASSEVRTRRLAILPTALTGAAVLTVQFVLCWIAAAYGGGNFTHMFVSLFTAHPPASQAALLEGTVFALIFGALTGALVAFFFNLFRAGRS